jgi:hypothetical protein
MIKYIPYLCIFLLLKGTSGFASVENLKLLYEKQKDDDELPKEIVVVSLGSHCQSSFILRELGLRWCAMPLDWLLSLDHKGLIRLLDDRFYHMFDEKYLVQYPEGYVINTLYSLDFRHDWSKLDLLGELPEIASKHSRRIERFFHLPEITKRVVFVRTVFDPKLNVLNNMPTYTSACTIIDADQAQELYTCLHNKFPDLKFMLAIINFTHTDSGITSDMHGIVEFKVENLVKDYKQFLHHLGDPNFFDALYNERR